MPFDTYALVKTAAWLLSPLPLAVAGLLLGLLLAWRKRGRSGIGLAMLSLGLLWAASLPWVAWRLAFSLESRYPMLNAQATPVADVAVVLGGALAAQRLPLNPQINLGSAADRVFFAGELYRAGKVRALILSGGLQPGDEGVPPEAEVMRELLRNLRVPDAAMHLEARSRTTRENAGYSLQLIHELRARRVLVVTSALHMPRAMAYFRQVTAGSGVTVIAASTDGEALGQDNEGLRQWLPDAGALAWSSRSVKEYLGWLQAGFLHWWVEKGMA